MKNIQLGGNLICAKCSTLLVPLADDYIPKEGDIIICQHCGYKNPINELCDNLVSNQINEHEDDILDILTKEINQQVIGSINFKNENK